MVTYEEVWESEFAPIISKQIDRRTTRQSESFLDAPLSLCGEEVRQMTPEDLLMFDGFGSPFVCGNPYDATTHDIEFFIWQLHTANNHTGGVMNYFRRGKVMGRLRKLNPEQVIAEIDEYCGRMFADMPSGGEQEEIQGDESLRKQPSIHFLAPLLMAVASEIGALDPMSGSLLSRTPLPRLFQYQRATGKYATDDTDVASMRSRCLARVNELNAAERNKESNGIL